MLIENIKNKLFLNTSIIIFFLCLTIFTGFGLFRIGTDLNLHAEAIGEIAKGNVSPPPNFLYYLMVYIFAFSRTDLYSLYLSSIVICSLAVTAKYIITKHFIIRYNKGHNDIFYSLSSILLIFIFSVPISLLLKGNYYLGNIPPNVWHNSTTIFLMPFALLLFWQSYEQLEQPNVNRIFLLSGLVIINFLIKPSYLFVFLLSYPLFVIITLYKKKKHLLVNLIPVLIGYLGIAIQYVAIYIFEMGALYEGDSQTGIGFFTVWSHFSPNIPISFLGSSLFPLLYFCFYYKNIKDYLILKYIICQYVIGIMFFIIFMETGPRQWHGNFIWQSIVTSYLFYLTIYTIFSRKFNIINSSWNNICINIFNQSNNKDKIILVSLLLHFVSGIFYLIKIFITNSYF